MIAWAVLRSGTEIKKYLSTGRATLFWRSTGIPISGHGRGPPEFAEQSLMLYARSAPGAGVVFSDGSPAVGCKIGYN